MSTTGNQDAKRSHKSAKIKDNKHNQVSTKIACHSSEVHAGLGTLGVKLELTHLTSNKRKSSNRLRLV